MSGSIGPCLPPGFKVISSDSEEDSESDSGLIGPAIPKPVKSADQPNVIGPVLPPGFCINNESDSESNESGFKKPESDEESFGPSLPPRFTPNKVEYNLIFPPTFKKVNDDKNIVGPSIPPGFEKIESDEESFGPSLPPGFKMHDSSEDEDSDDDGIIGPMPTSMQKQSYSVAEEFEQRANKMKNKLTGKEEVPVVTKRETWMIDLPEEKGLSIALGLQARSFSTSNKPKAEQDKSWGDAPEDKERKEKERSAAEKRKTSDSSHRKRSAKERKIDEDIAKHNEKRGKSLLDQHQEKLLKKQQEEEKEKPKERRPFDREVDMKLNQIDPEKRAEMIRRSHDLNTRFGHGTNKYV